MAEAGKARHDEESQQQQQQPPQGYRVLEIDPAVQKRVVRKIDLRLMPLVMALCTSHAGSCPLL